MPEYAPKAIWRIFTTVDQAHADAVNSGIVGNSAHTYGFHRSRNALVAAGRSSDYSLQGAVNWKGDGDAAAALDISGPQWLLQQICRNLLDACNARDPRIVGRLREFGGTLDGKTVTARRVSDNAKISFDASHITHNHVSVFRAYVNDDEVCQGIAQVMLGIPLDQTPWDGKSFPGAWVFHIGNSHPAVQWLGERLVVHGYTAHNDGDGYQPGPEFTEYDEANVKDFQIAQGWRDGDADGIPGPITWTLLSKDPVIPDPPPEPEPTPEPEPEPEPQLTEATVMSFNMQNGQKSTADKRLPLIVKAIRAVNPSVILAQECSDAYAAKVNAELGARWHYRTDDTNDNVGNTIFYRDDWVDNGKKQIPLPTPHSGPGGYPRGLLRVALNHVKTGERLWVFTTHFTATGWPSTMTPEQASAERAAQAKAVAAYLATYRYFVLGGDFNTSNRAAFTSVGNYPLSTMAGVTNRDQASFDSSATPGRWIDDLIIHSNGEASGVEFVSGGLHLTGGASDHNAPYAVIRLRPRKEQA